MAYNLKHENKNRDNSSYDSISLTIVLLYKIFKSNISY